MNGVDMAATERETLRQGILSILQRLTERGKALDLPPPPALAEYRGRLRGDTYTVLVVGEAKRGKSSFVNALIGKPLLPTDVQVATNQVFRVTHADQVAYRLRFEDGSERAIDTSDLARYGSQVAADADEMPRLDQLLRWIEVDTPIRFLPPGLSLLDTPGLGSLYAPHAQVTQRFVPHADAVIFTLDSTRPIGQLDLEFVETILGVTPNIFFIQTMIDQHARAHWQEMQRRNQDILAARFHDRLADTRVWPISSALLLKGAQTGDDDFVLVSKHKELMAALQAFLFRVAGLDRYAQALALAEGYHRMAGKALAARLASLGDGAKAQQAAVQQRASQRRAQFEAEWGPRGQRMGELREAVRRTTTVGKQGFLQALQPGGDIAQELEARIDALTTVAEANQLGERLAADVVAAAGALWKRIGAQVEARLVEQVRPLAEETVSLGIAQDPALGAVDTGAPMTAIKDDWWTRIRGAYSNTSALVGLGNLVPGLGQLAHLAAIWSLVRGSWSGANNPLLKTAQQELRRYLNTVLGRVRRHFIDVDLGSGRASLVDEYFSGLEQAVNARVQEVVREHASQAKQEVERLVETAKMDEAQRAKQAATIREALLAWEQLGKGIADLAARLREATRPAAPGGM